MMAKPQAHQMFVLLGDALEPQGPVGDALGVVGDDADYLTEAERDDGQVIAAHPENGEAHQKSAKGRYDAAAMTSETMKGVVITESGQMQGSMMKEISFSSGVSVSRAEV